MVTKKNKRSEKKISLVRKKKKKVGTENFGTLVISWDLKFIVSDWLIFDLLKIIEIKTKSGFNLKKKKL